jgi:hypothetical protein
MFADKEDFAKAWSLYKKGCLAFKQFIGGVRPLADSIPSLVFGKESESQLDLSYRGASYRFRLQALTEQNRPAMCVISLLKTHVDDEQFHPFRSISIGTTAMATASSGIMIVPMLTEDHKTQNGYEPAFFYLLGGE